MDFMVRRAWSGSDVGLCHVPFGEACLACAGYGDCVLAVFGQQAVKEMATTASQLSSTCSFGRRSRRQQRYGYNSEFRLQRDSPGLKEMMEAKESL